MAVELITGRGSTNHVGSEDVGAYQAYTFGTGTYVLHGCEASVIDSNTIRISEGEMLVNGRHVRVKGSEDITIQSGMPGKNRNDLLVVSYKKSTVTIEVKNENGDIVEVESDVEDSPIVAIVGTPVEGTASDPSYIVGSILSGDPAAQFPMYRVPISGLTVGEPVLLMEREEALLAQIAGIIAQLAGKADAKSYLPLAGGRITGALSFKNGAYIMGVNTSGVASSSFEAKTPNNRTTMGYGGFAANEGATDIYGHAVSIQANANFNFYGTDMYKNGNVIWAGRVLFANDAGSTGTITLTESAANFTLLEIYYMDNDGGYSMAKVYSPNGKTASLMNAFLKTDGSTTVKAMYFKLRRVVISGTSVYSTGLVGESQTLGNNACSAYTSNAIIGIVKVVGYK